MDGRDIARLEIALRPRFGRMADVAQALERIVPVDVLGLRPARQRYAFFANDSSSIAIAIRRRE